MVNVPALIVKLPLGGSIRLPEKVPEAFVSVKRLVAPKSTVPLPLIVLTLTPVFALAMLNIAPAATVIGLFGKPPLPLTYKIDVPFTFVAPEYVFAPVNV